jgi:hypothetical protein
VPLLPWWLTTDMFIQIILPLVPVFICLCLFVWGARRGYVLHGIGIKPIYLSRRFKGTVGFVRDFQDEFNKDETARFSLSESGVLHNIS